MRSKELRLAPCSDTTASAAIMGFNKAFTETNFSYVKTVEMH